MNSKMNSSMGHLNSMGQGVNQVNAMGQVISAMMRPMGP